jgi:hypothetical protein
MKDSSAAVLRKKFQDALEGLWPVAKGSLARVRRPCVRSKCRACASGKKHAMWIFSCMEAGRRRCLYVPQRLVPALRRAIANGRALEGWVSRTGVEWLRIERCADPGKAKGRP